MLLVHSTGHDQSRSHLNKGASTVFDPVTCTIVWVATSGKAVLRSLESRVSQNLERAKAPNSGKYFGEALYGGLSLAGLS